MFHTKRIAKFKNLPKTKTLIGLLLLTVVARNHKVWACPA